MGLYGASGQQMKVLEERNNFTFCLNAVVNRYGTVSSTCCRPRRKTRIAPRDHDTAQEPIPCEAFVGVRAPLHARCLGLAQRRWLLVPELDGQPRRDGCLKDDMVHGEHHRLTGWHDVASCDRVQPDVVTHAVLGEGEDHVPVMRWEHDA